MKQSSWKVYGAWILLAEAVGALSGWLARKEMEIYSEVVRQPPLSPPSVVFPIVWGILYALMGVGAARIAQMPESRQRTQSLWIFGIQLAVNFFWSLIFFNLQSFGLALIWLVLLWGLVLGMIFVFRRVDSLAAWLQVLYLLWVTFAVYLNLGVWLMNP